MNDNETSALRIAAATYLLSRLPKPRAMDEHAVASVPDGVEAFVDYVTAREAYVRACARVGVDIDAALLEAEASVFDCTCDQAR
jgi:hypothetical protein